MINADGEQPAFPSRDPKRCRSTKSIRARNAIRHGSPAKALLRALWTRSIYGTPKLGVDRSSPNRVRSEAPAGCSHSRLLAVVIRARRAPREWVPTWLG